MLKKSWFKALTVILILLSFATIELEVDAAKRVRVKGYYRKDGTYVRPHYRTAPDGNPYNNYSYPGNYNPNTGKITPGNPQTYLDRYYNRSKTNATGQVGLTARNTVIQSGSIARNTTQNYTTLAAFRTKYASTLKLSFQELQAILAVKAYDEFYGASILSNNIKRTYLGKIGGTNDSNSIFHKYGNHGSDYGSNSIWNDVGQYGSNFGTYSSFNNTASSPPLIVKDGKIIGYLTVNSYKTSRVNPFLLKAIFGEE